MTDKDLKTLDRVEKGWECCVGYNDPNSCRECPYNSQDNVTCSHDHLEMETWYIIKLLKQEVANGK